MPPLISATGFSNVGSVRSDYLLDIILVHGIQGHPRTTWADEKTGKYWPSDLLPASFPKARILVYGYDSKVSHFFSGPTNQSSFLDHAKNLLLDLQGVRKDEPKRPLLFICHSLGGILVKDVIRRCEIGRETLQREAYEDIFLSLTGILFLGTPHRGGNYGSLGKTAERVVRYLGFDTNDSILRDLQSNSTAFELINDEFLRVLRAPVYHEESFRPVTIYTFQESTGLAGVRGLNGKVVDDASSKLGFNQEVVASLSGNHMDMCRNLNEGGADYERMKNAIETCFCLGEDMSSWRSRWRSERRGLRPPSLQKRIHKLPFDKDPNFVGRETELQALANMLSDDLGEFALVGLGGAGKTQIAIEFAHRLLQQESELEPNARRQVFWLHASSVSRLEQGLREIMDHVNGPDLTNTYLSSFREWFSDRQSGRWLIVIDNADDEEMFFSDVFHSTANQDIDWRPWIPPSAAKSERHRLCDFLPKKSGCSILYTSRNNICATRLTCRSGPANLVMVNPMPNADAIALVENGLRGHLTEHDLASMRTFTEKLVVVLDNLPLAISQATAMMRENGDFRDPKAYLELYSEVRDEQGKFLEENFVDWRRHSDLPNSVFLSWKISLEQLKKRSESAVLLLSLFSVLDRQGIPEWLLAFFPKVSRYDRAVGLNMLHSFSFISRPDATPDKKKWQMHRLVQIATHAWIGRDGLEHTLRMAIRMLAEAFMGHLSDIGDRNLRLQKSLEYYPHAKSVLFLLDSIGLSNRSPAVQKTLSSFANEFYGKNKEITDKLSWAVDFVSQSDFTTLESMHLFVEELTGESNFWFRYYGIRPLVSTPLYHALVNNTESDDFDSRTFTEVDGIPQR